MYIVTDLQHGKRYAYWCPNTISAYQMMSVSFNSNTTGAASGTGIAISSRTHEFIQFLVGCVLFNLLTADGFLWVLWFPVPTM
jgi:hypothetical protein